MFSFTPHSIFKTVAGGISAFVLLTGPVSAQSQTETFSLNTPLQSLSSSGNLTLPDFDTSLGSLNGVTITLTFSTLVKTTLYSSSNPINTVIYNPGNYYTATTGSGPHTIDPRGTAYDPFRDAGTGPTITGTKPESETITQQVDPSQLILWENQPSNEVDLSYSNGSANFQGTSLGNSPFFSGGHPGTGKIAVDYTYDTAAVPEPAGKYLTVLAAAAAVILVVRRKKQPNPIVV